VETKNGRWRLGLARCHGGRLHPGCADCQGEAKAARRATCSGANSAVGFSATLSLLWSGRGARARLLTAPAPAIALPNSPCTFVLQGKEKEKELLDHLKAYFIEKGERRRGALAGSSCRRRQPHTLLCWSICSSRGGLQCCRDDAGHPLEEGWRVEVKIRTTGTSLGTTDAVRCQPPGCLYPAFLLPPSCCKLFAVSCTQATCGGMPFGDQSAAPCLGALEILLPLWPRCHVALSQLCCNPSLAAVLLLAV
jgi:hypothetical protein